MNEFPQSGQPSASDLEAHLTASRPEPPDSAFTQSVMNRVRSEGVAAQAFTQARPADLSLTFSDAVMDRVRAESAKRSKSRGLRVLGSNSRLSGWISHAGTAIAAALAVAVGLSFNSPSNSPQPSDTGTNAHANMTDTPEAARESSGALADGHAHAIQLVDEESDALSAMLAVDVLRGRVRERRWFDGKAYAIASLGTQDGVRNGDQLVWRSPNREHAGTLVVVGVSPHAAICEPTSASGQDIPIRSLVSTRHPTELQRAATERLKSTGTLQERGAYWGMGVIFESNGDALRVKECIPRYWYQDMPRSAPTRAASLGLRDGDVLVKLNGVEVHNWAQLDAVLEETPRIGPKARPLTCTVIRNNQRVELSEAD